MTQHSYQPKAEAVAQLDRLIGKQQARISDANTKLDALKRQREALTRPAEPCWNGVDPVVIRFKKQFPGSPIVHKYAAIRSGFPPRPWAVTHTLTGPRLPAKSWGELLDFIGENRWDSIEVMMPSSSITLNTAGESAADRLQRLQAQQFAKGRF
ncbi:hypothetical protein B5566_02625 [Mycobacterium sp. MHSD3]|nr:hypothetical protein B5566_02625 [Mycobacterium sp. MHSD3]